MTGLGDVMREARARLVVHGRPMTQETLAEMTGLSTGTIGQIENGKTLRPTRDTLERIATALQVSYNDLAVAAGMADPPTERDVEAEIRRIAALDGVGERMTALKQLSPVVYDLVRAWATDLVRQAAALGGEDNTQEQEGQQHHQRVPDSGRRSGQ